VTLRNGDERGVALTQQADTTRDWHDTVFSARELLSLSEDELEQLEKTGGDIPLLAEWWRRRRSAD
jgi:hypothetical protein